MKDKEGNVIVVDEENAADVARKEMELEKEGKDPESEVVEDLKLQPEKEEEDKPEEKSEDKPEEKSDEDIISANPEDLTEDEKDRQTTLIEAEETESTRLLEAKEEDLDEDDKEKRKVAALKQETKGKEAFEGKVKSYSEEKKIGIEESRRTLESANKIVDKYKGNKEEIAIANLNLQQLVAIKDEEISAVKQEASQPKRPQSAREWEIGIKDKGLTGPDGKFSDWETVVEKYRTDHPKDCDGFDDEQVLKIVSKEIHLNSTVYYKEQKLRAKSNADEKRVQLINSLSEDNKPYSEDIRGLLKTISDKVILHKDYNIDHSIRWARGGYFTPDKLAELEKVAELKGFTRGQASKRIISGPTGDGKPPKGKGTITWSGKEREQAFDMFPNVDDEKEIYKLYNEIKAGRAKNKKKE